MVARGAEEFAVGPQYDTTDVYVGPDDVDKFVDSFTATFGGKSTKQVVVTVTPRSSTNSQLLLAPAGSVSVFGFKTSIPYPFGHERTGYLVTDLDAAVRSAQGAGAAPLARKAVNHAASIYLAISIM